MSEQEVGIDNQIDISERETVYAIAIKTLFEPEEAAISQQPSTGRFQRLKERLVAPNPIQLQEKVREELRRELDLRDDRSLDDTFRRFKEFIAPLPARINELLNDPQVPPDVIDKLKTIRDELQVGHDQRQYLIMRLMVEYYKPLCKQHGISNVTMNNFFKAMMSRLFPALTMSRRMEELQGSKDRIAFGIWEMRNYGNILDQLRSILAERKGAKEVRQILSEEARLSSLPAQVSSIMRKSIIKYGLQHYCPNEMVQQWLRQALQEKAAEQIYSQVDAQRGKARLENFISGAVFFPEQRMLILIETIKQHEEPNNFLLQMELTRRLLEMGFTQEEIDKGMILFREYSDIDGITDYTDITHRKPQREVYVNQSGEIRENPQQQPDPNLLTNKDREVLSEALQRFLALLKIPRQIATHFGSYEEFSASLGKRDMTGIETKKNAMYNPKEGGVESFCWSVRL